MVGGGVAGLVAARELASAGLRVLVVEARDRVGGAVRGHVVGGLELDAGAESFATRGGTVAAYLADLGLTDRITSPAPLGSWVHLPTGDGPLPRTGLLGIPSSPWSRDVRRTLGTVGAARAALDLVLPRRVGAGTTSLGGLVRARMGSRVVDRLVRPVVAGVHAAEPDELAVDAVAPGLPAALAEHRSLARAVRTLRAAAPAGSAVQGLVGGMHTLVTALEADLAAHGAQVRTRTRALRLIPPPTADVPTRARPLDVRGGDAASAVDGVGLDGVGTDGVGPDEVGIELSDGSVVRAQRVVVATPEAAGLLASLLPGTSVGLDAGADVRLVTLVLDAPALDAAPRGTGVLVAREATDVVAKALTHATAKWPWLAERTGPGRHVVRLSYGRGDDAPAGDAAPADDAALAGDGASGDAASDDAAAAPGPRAPSDDDALVRRALADASTLLGVPLAEEQVVASAVVRWTQALPRPSAQHRDAVATVRASLAEHASRPGGARVAACGAWLAGNGLASVLPDAAAAARSVLRAT
nr:FAD-dependent oxidoreductase [Cellulomonas fulva]